MTQLEKQQLKEFRKYLRLSSQRDLYTIPQAAFRLGVSRNVFEDEYVKTGLIKLKIVRGEKRVARSELDRAISEMDNIIHRSAIKN